jgi:Family of unknown function (DUF5696)
MLRFFRVIACGIVSIPFSWVLVCGQTLSRAEWGAPEVKVSHADGKWTIAGKKQTVVLDEKTLEMTVDAGPVKWGMAASQADDVLVKSGGEEFTLRLADAEKIDITPYDTGYKTGVKIRLERFRNNGQLHSGGELDLALVLTACLEGKEEDLVCDAVAIEHEAAVRQLDWPKEFDTRAAKYSALNHVRGNLLPCDWPKPYHPYLNIPSADQQQFVKTDKSYIQSNLIETWSMSWWGFQKGRSALVVIVETPDDAAYKFDHPAGGPTVLGPRWLPSLGRLAYPRSVRMCFQSEGDYVTMAKRYRRYAIDIGRFVSLKEKIAQEPLVAKLVGAPRMGQRILKNFKPGSYRYREGQPEHNYQVTSFDERTAELRKLKAKGIEGVVVSLSAWPREGYDRQHPDVLPPAPAAGGYEGMKKWADTCKELGYVAMLHDQYRDYYVDAPSWDPQFAVHEEDNIKDASAFPGTRFGGWKEGYIPFMDYWDGGKMSYISERFALGHLIKNYQGLLDHGIKVQGSYLDVFGYVPPTEDFNPEHPTTRADAMKARADCFRWARRNLGIVGTEDGADWVVPYVDYCTDANAGSVIPVPLYMLVYHDAVMTPEGGNGDYLRCLLNGGYGSVPREVDNERDMERMRTICALHKRVALLEMTKHEFLDENHRKERTTFADGTTVTIDRDAKTFEVKPELEL